MTTKTDMNMTKKTENTDYMKMEHFDWPIRKYIGHLGLKTRSPGHNQFIYVSAEFNLSTLNYILIISLRNYQNIIHLH